MKGNLLYTPTRLPRAKSLIKAEGGLINYSCSLMTKCTFEKYLVVGYCSRWVLWFLNKFFIKPFFTS